MWLHVLSLAGAGFLVMAGCGCTQSAAVVDLNPGKSNMSTTITAKAGCGLQSGERQAASNLRTVV